MKKYIIPAVFITVFLLCDYPVVHAQTVLWAKKGSSEGFDNGNAITTDDSGNVYVTGQTEFSADYDSHILNSWGSHDILVAKYSTNGSIDWIHNAGGRGGDVGHGIGVDAVHNTYVIGEVEDTAYFGSGISINSHGANDIFIAKYDIEGNITWAKGFGSSLNDKGEAIVVTPSGDCYMTGYFSSSTNFGGTPMNSIGGYDIFIIKTNSSGQVQWAQRAGGEGNDRGNGIAIDASGNVYVTGTFYQAATFNNTTISCPSKTCTFLAKYDSTGQFQWATAAGATDTTKSNAISLDENGNIYLTGYFKTVTQFGSYNFTSQGISDVFIVKYDPSGNVVWAKQAGGSDADDGDGICVDKLNHLIYITGEVHQPGYFDTCYFNTRGFMDIFVAAYTMDGNARWVRIYGGHLRDAGAAVTVDPLGNIYSTGLFNDVADFGGITLTGYPNQPWADFYIDKILPPLAMPATNVSTDVSISSINCTDLFLSFTPGNGSRRIIVAHKDAAVNSNPINGNTYSADPVFGNGSNLGYDNFVVYNGSGNNVTITGLTSGTTYYFSIFEYNGSGVLRNYKTDTFPSISAMAPLYTINISGLQNSICNGDSINLIASNASTYSWSPNNNLSSGIGSSVIAKPFTTTTYTVTGLTDLGCQSQANFTINVNPLPSVNVTSFNSVCSNAPSFILTGGTPSGGIYSGTGVNEGQFNPVTAGSGTFMIQYNYTDVNGCSNKTQTSITVNASPQITITPIPTLCINGIPVILSIGFPVGGIYSGTGVSSGIFDPSVGAGTYIISYSYTDNNGCTETSSVLADVESLPTISLGNDRIVCAGESTVINAGGGFASYSWSTGETTSSILVDSSGTGLGAKNVFVVVSNAAGCRNSSEIQVTFDICSGISTAKNDFQNISVYPNPFQNTFTFKTDKNVSFSIYDMCGRELDKIENVNASICSGENLSPGVYFIVIISGLNRKIFSVLKTE